MTPAAPYDEFGLLGDNAAEAGLPFPGPPAVRRQAFTLAAGQAVSAIRWGTTEPELVLPDGRWTWRYDLFGELPASQFEYTALWDDVSAIGAPVMLVRGGDSKFVTDNDVAEFRRRMPGVRTEVVAGAGHAIQSDQPLALTALISDFVYGSLGAA
jgi:pimeloyl-ACP methyl ester carboxylesterase